LIGPFEGKSPTLKIRAWGTRKSAQGKPGTEAGRDKGLGADGLMAKRRRDAALQKAKAAELGKDGQALRYKKARRGEWVSLNYDSLCHDQENSK